MKTYQIMTYNLDGTYKDTLNPNDILNEVRFSANLDGGLGELNIQTTYPVSNTDYHGGEFVKVVLYDDFHKDGLQIYYGYISQIVKQIEANREYTTFNCLGVNSLLKSILYTNGEYSKTPAVAVDDIVNFFATYYNCITMGDNGLTTDVQNYNRQYQNCFDIIKSICEGDGRHFYVNGEGILSTFIWSGKSHLLHLHYDIEKVQITDTIEDLVNHYQLSRNGGTTATYQDELSISTYGQKMRYESNTELNSSATQDQYGNQFISDNKNPKETIQITLNKNYDFETINPGDLVTIVNSEIGIVNKLVNKISYSPDKATLTIEKQDTLWEILDE